MPKKNMPKPVVLYADDDHDDIDLLNFAFKPFSNDVELITTLDGFEAFSYLSNLEPFEPAPCLIILDINMPRMGGKETLKKIRSLKRFAATPVVLFSTSSLRSDEEFAKSYNAGFITKPLNLKQIGNIAEQFMSHCTDQIKESLKKKVL